MQIQSGGVSNLTQIGTRHHPDLQQLNQSDDHLAYPPAGWHHNAAGITFGLDANKPGTIAADNIYIATDTKKMYYSYVANTWTEVSGAFAELSAVQGSVLFKGAQGWKSLAPGSVGQALMSNGSNADPSFGNIIAGYVSITAFETITKGQALRLMSIASSYVNGMTISTNASNDVGNNSSLDTKDAQSFTVGGSPLTIDTIHVKGSRVNNPIGDIIFEVQTDSAGTPSGSVLATGYIPAAALGTTDADIYVPLNESLTLSASTVYWIVFYASNGVNGSNFFQLARSISDVYAGGVLARYNGSAWSNSTWDLFLELGTSTISSAVSLACANDGHFNGSDFVGFAAANASAGSTVSVLASGEDTLFSGLQPGVTQYLSDTRGAISPTVGTHTKKLGYALSATSVIISL